MVFRGSDTTPKETFLNHQAGLSGFGGSSAMDAVALRDRDANSGWAAAADGTREERVYHCQNWRGDVVALVNASGTLAERAMYDAYGVVFGSPLGDVNGNGTADATDEGIINFNIGTWVAACDLDLDGDTDATDESIASGNRGTTLGRGVLSEDATVSGGLGNRKGYAGYEHDTANHKIMHVRHRVYHAQLGRWTRRDPLGYVDGSNLYQYAISSPMGYIDSTGLVAITNTCDLDFYDDMLLVDAANGQEDEDEGVPWWHYLFFFIPGGCSSAPSPPPPAGCTAPEPNPNPTPAECCEAIRNATCFDGSGGGVVCCKGVKVSCSWQPNPTTPGGDIIHGCTIEHEDDHHDDITCAGCFSGNVCRPPWKSGKNPNTEECKAHKIEIKCLQRRRPECNSKPGMTPEQRKACRDRVDRRIEQQCKNAAKYCGSRPKNCPTPTGP